ncbi:DUF397 domain-containing protein [Actinoalloteichus hymeniacidonis]|uniref:DUF397 family protein n=1 Tax=Actinoalloteichus hymeniacidonis TaxID=340345 RepID=A0AAC9HVH3_9PSEU|nr:DUF397 domain-containing protein [Actinoalloteichus hymeniacidonis]AOS66070.1 putative DUF397 family protein [Actinoalloteichus hymeniacidonis]MBB5905827.1 hypothetical protein [Actinoalloteichus hymeniacidonis]
MTVPKNSLWGWRKTARSGPEGNCVELGQAPGLVGIRDTKNRDGGTLVVDRELFGAFLAAVKTNRLG